jgi:hypothetical protein
VIAAPGHSPTGLRREAFGAAVLVLLGVGLRFAFIRAFPTNPFSDFHALIQFGTRLRDQGLAAPGWGWVQFNPGLPLVLSVLLRLFPSDPASAARVATAVVTGLTGLAPFLVWRHVLAFRGRLLAGLVLALWPGQVFFSGVVAQENWALLPAVALACLGVRGVRRPDLRAHPILAGLLYAATCAIRQEMLVVLLPLLLPAAGVLPRGPGRGRRLAFLAVAAGVPLLLLAAERRAASGRFSLTTEHGGLGILGSLVPGAAADGWVDPTAYVAARRPELLRDLKGLRDSAGGLAREELRRRWRYHAFRAGVASMRLLSDSDAENLFWSVGAADALPDGRRAAGAAFAARWAPALRVELAVIAGLFAGAVISGIRRRDRAILLLAAAVLLKLGIQAWISAMGRLMVPAVAFELLAIALAAAALTRPLRRERAVFLAVAASVAVLLLAATPPLRALARRKDELPLPIRRFPLALGGGGFAECTVDAGRLTGVEWGRARLSLAGESPAPGESARVTCDLPRDRSDLTLRLEDPYAPSGYTGRVLERVDADGHELLRHDVGGPEGATWLAVPLRDSRRVTIEILAVRPDPGWAWGPASASGFEIGKP